MVVGASVVVDAAVVEATEVDGAELDEGDDATTPAAMARSGAAPSALAG